MSDSVLSIEDHAGVRRITLNRPDKLNALDTALTRSLRDALAGAEVDESVRAIVLYGAGRGFCAGADVGEFKHLTPANQHLVEARADLSAQLYGSISRMKKPVVGAVHGVAMGGGAGLAIACDMLVVAADLKFAFPEVKHGLVPALVMTHIQRQFPPKLAFELISTGRQLTGEELGRLGIANKVVHGSAVLTEAEEIASAWAQAPPKSLQAMKGLYHLVSDLTFDAAMREGQAENARMRAYRSAG
jgi:enoyl-CoA hydratase/carnithine racemase